MTKGDKHLNILLFTSNGSGFSAVLSLKFLEYGKDQSIAWLGNCLTWCNSQPIVVAAPQDKPPNMHHKVYVGMRVCVWKIRKHDKRADWKSWGNNIHSSISHMIKNSIHQYYGISKSPTSWSVLIGQGSWGYKIYHLIWGKLFPNSPESAAMFGDTYSMTNHSESPLPVIHGLKWAYHSINGVITWNL